MDPSTAAAPAQIPPQISEVLDSGVLLLQFFLLCGIIERAVAMFKHLWQIDWRKPWLMIAFLLTWAICVSRNIDLITMVYANSPIGPILWVVPGEWLGILISALCATGGSAGMVSMFNKAISRRDEIHQKKMEKMDAGNGG